jgi:hypothetical protein
MKKYNFGQIVARGYTLALSWLDSYIQLPGLENPLGLSRFGLRIKNVLGEDN